MAQPTPPLGWEITGRKRRIESNGKRGLEGTYVVWLSLKCIKCGFQHSVSQSVVTPTLKLPHTNPDGDLCTVRPKDLELHRLRSQLVELRSQLTAKDMETVGLRKELTDKEAELRSQLAAKDIETIGLRKELTDKEAEVIALKSNTERLEREAIDKEADHQVKIASLKAECEIEVEHMKNRVKCYNIAMDLPFEDMLKTFWGASNSNPDTSKMVSKAAIKKLLAKTHPDKAGDKTYTAAEVSALLTELL